MENISFISSEIAKLVVNYVKHCYDFLLMGILIQSLDILGRSGIKSMILLVCPKINIQLSLVKTAIGMNS